MKKRLIKKIIFAALGALLLLLGGCAQFQAAPELNPEIEYQPDIYLRADGREGRGFLVLPNKSYLDIEVKSPGKISMLLATSCHRQESNYDIKSGWFRSGKEFTYRHTPNGDVENCLLRFESFDQSSKKRHAWGLIAMASPIDSLPAELYCDGSHAFPRGNSKAMLGGTSLCIAWHGLDQRIIFKSPVDVVFDDPNCAIPVSADGKTWDFKIKKHLCVYIFADKKAPYDTHNLTTFGYDEVPVRIK